MKYHVRMKLIEDQLRAIAKTTRNGRVSLGVLKVVAVSLAVWLAWCGLDNLLRLPGSLRFVMAVVGLVLPAISVWRNLLRPSVWRINLQQTARELEVNLGVNDNILINSFQFEDAQSKARKNGAPFFPVQSKSGDSREFIERTLAAGSQSTMHIPRRALLDRVSLIRLGVATGAFFIAWILYASCCSRQAKNAFARYVNPFADIPPVGDVVLTLDPHGDMFVSEGGSLQVHVMLANPNGEPLAAVPFIPVLSIAQKSGGFAHDATFEIELRADPNSPSTFFHRFDNIREPFVCRAECGEDYSTSLRVNVRRLPRISSASFKVTPPAYLGIADKTLPGPPAALSAFAGSHVALDVEFDMQPIDPMWRIGDVVIPLADDTKSTDLWHAQFHVDTATQYALLARGDKSDESAGEIVHGAISIIPDIVPSIRFANDARNILAWPGETIDLRVVAEDDHGTSAIWITARQATATQTEHEVLHRWSYGDAPGRKGEIEERFELEIDPSRFEAGNAYLVEAFAADCRPDSGIAAGKSDPIVIRIRTASDADASKSGMVAALQRAIAEQRRALGLSRNLALHLDEAIAGENLAPHRDAMDGAQTQAREQGRSALAAMEEGAGSSKDKLNALVEGEMGLALGDIAKIAPEKTGELPRILERLVARQQAIFDGLLSLLGSTAAREKTARRENEGGTPQAPLATDEDNARDLREVLKDFTSVQKRILEQSRSLLERGPDDLSDEDEEILGKLAREEAKLAAALKDKVDDLSRNPLQDFADGSLADEFNEVYQEVAKAAASLYEKKLELAVPMEQGGLENAERLLHNLERWLVNKPDYIKWLMEDPPTTPDAAIAELPDELEDIVGELLDSEEEMTEDVEDVTSAWIDSLDKGAGWDAADGPISSMSAKGVTGNQLPNQMEIGGRSGEGRTGRSQGQMVESAAEGKDGRQTPSRLTATPFESGSVEDSSTQSPGGATGGGKLAGFAGEGLRGPTPTPRLQGLQRLEGRQMEIRQAAERLSLHLRAYGLPSGDVEQAIRGMKEVEALARSGDGGVLRRAYDETVDSLREARGSIATAITARREHGAMPRKEATELWNGLQDEIPEGYEELVPAYFKRLAEEATLK